jgi:hypothetical protein
MRQTPCKIANRARAAEMPRDGRTAWRQSAVAGAWRRALETWIDEVARAVAKGTSRRDVFRWLGAGLVAISGAAVAPKRAGAEATLLADGATRSSIRLASRFKRGCPSGSHSCGGSCVSDSSPNSCGTSCTPCPTDPHGAATCTNGACGITCDSGFQFQNGACCETCLSLCCAPPKHCCKVCGGSIPVCVDVSQICPP